MPSIKGILKAVGPRVIAVIAAMVSAKLAEKQIQVEPETLTGIMLGTYAAVHRAASAYINPGDAAKGRVADGIKSAADDPRTDNVVRVPEE